MCVPWFHREALQKCSLLTDCVCACQCSVHYQEYLVGLINRHGIDPAEVMTEQELILLLQKNEKDVPHQQRGENPEKYRQQLLQVYLITFQTMKLKRLSQ